MKIIIIMEINLTNMWGRILPDLRPGELPLHCTLPPHPYHPGSSSNPVVITGWTQSATIHR